jgi:FTR1 family protein
MLPALAMTFRDGVAAFLAVGVFAAVFSRTGKSRLLTATKWAIALSLFTTPAAGALFSLAENQALWEGVLALAAAVCVAWMTAQLWHTSRAPSPASGAAPVTVFSALVVWLIVALLITRGGMEIALLVGTMVWHVPDRSLIGGAALGTALAIIVAWLWTRLVRRLPATAFRYATAAFLLAFIAHLLVDGVHEISEANVIAGTHRLHDATESFSSEGIYGQYAPYLLILLPAAAALVALFWSHGKASTGRVAHLDG